jgi:hypothetical protein
MDHRGRPPRTFADPLERRAFLRLCAGSALTLAAGVSGCGGGGQSVGAYSITNPFGASGEISDINNKGEIVGFVGDTSFRDPYDSSRKIVGDTKSRAVSTPVLKRPGQPPITLSIPGAGPDQSGVAVSINDNSQILAVIGTKTYLGQEGEFQVLFDNTSKRDAQKLNNDGTVLFLDYSDSSNTRVGLWKDGSVTFIDGLSTGFPSLINNKNQVFGTAGPSGIDYPVMWNNGSLQKLRDDQEKGIDFTSGNYPGPISPEVLLGGINDSGQAVAVVGTVLTRNGAYLHPVIWHGDNFGTVDKLQKIADTDLPTVNGINNAGAIVGAENNGFHDAAILWRDATSPPVYLQSLIAPHSGWTLFSATAINDSGLIVGVGQHGSVKQYSGFLLTANT